MMDPADIKETWLLRKNSWDPTYYFGNSVYQNFETKLWYPIASKLNFALSMARASQQQGCACSVLENVVQFWMNFSNSGKLLLELANHSIKPVTEMRMRNTNCHRIVEAISTNAVNKKVWCRLTFNKTHTTKENNTVSKNFAEYKAQHLIRLCI